MTQTDITSNFVRSEFIKMLKAIFVFDNKQPFCNISLFTGH